MGQDDENITTVKSRRIISKIMSRHFDARGKFRLLAKDEADDEYQGETRFVKHDADDGLIMVEALPAVTGRHLEMADKIEVRGVLDSLLTWFHTDKLKTVHEGNDRYYVIPYPDELYRLQRRNAFRIPLPRSMASQVEARIGEESTPVQRDIRTRIFDLSATGAAILVSQDDAEWLDVGTRLSGARLYVEGLLDIVVTMEVRNHRPGMKDDEVLIGVHFESLGATEAHALQRAVMEIQRTTL
ncbi:MAG: flagellar brake protein, partial [Halothiobacillaceae bacterium]